jgi:hypothetical protein
MRVGTNTHFSFVGRFNLVIILIWCLKIHYLCQKKFNDVIISIILIFLVVYIFIIEKKTIEKETILPYAKIKRLLQPFIVKGQKILHPFIVKVQAKPHFQKCYSKFVNKIKVSRAFASNLERKHTCVSLD